MGIQLLFPSRVYPGWSWRSNVELGTYKERYIASMDAMEKADDECHDYVRLMKFLLILLKIIAEIWNSMKPITHLSEPSDKFYYIFSECLLTIGLCKILYFQFFFSNIVTGSIFVNPSNLHASTQGYITKTLTKSDERCRKLAQIKARIHLIFPYHSNILRTKSLGGNVRQDEYGIPSEKVPLYNSFLGT